MTGENLSAENQIVSSVHKGPVILSLNTMPRNTKTMHTE